MTTLQFTGERFLPEATGAIAVEHCHRYAFARRFVAGRRVLDAACGEGYGTALLGDVAAEATGVDIDPVAIVHARSTYGTRDNVRFEIGSVAALPFADASFAVVVSFETIEHLDAEIQPRMLAEFARVLEPEGVLLLSSPNKRRYSDDRDYRNPYHCHELYRDDLSRLLDPHFPYRRWFHQRPAYASAVWGETALGGGDRCEAWTGGADRVEPMVVVDGLYHLVIASRTEGALPPAEVRLSLYADRGDTLLTRSEANAVEVLRQDAMLKERDDGLNRQGAHIAHLEQLVAERERIVGERDAQLAALNATHESLERALGETRAARASLEEAVAAAATAVADSRQALDEAAELVSARESELAKAREMAKLAQSEVRSLESALLAQERLIAYQHGFRWWLQLPLLRMKLGWQRRFGR